MRTLSNAVDMFVAYKWSVIVKHNTWMYVIQCYMFQSNEPSSGITLQKFTKEDNLQYAYCNLSYVLVYLGCLNVWKVMPVYGMSAETCCTGWKILKGLCFTLILNWCSV
jgi:hypothetical protein